MRKKGLLQGVIKRWKERGFEHAFSYSLGRFRTIRSLTRLYGRLIGPQKHYDYGRSIFSGIQPEEILNGLEKDSFFPDFNLPQSHLGRILAHAKNEKCLSTLRKTRHGYFYSEKNDLQKRLSGVFIRGQYVNPALRCPAIAEIQEDPLVLEVASRFLGRNPRKVSTQLFWSYAVKADDEDRLNRKQTILFHYDVAGLFFIYFNFYLTEADSQSGPHVLVRGSHRRKKWKYLFSSANCSDEEIEKQYGRKNILPIYGKPGFGFVEDASCFHKATPPISKDRLFLQVRMWV